MLVFGRVEQQDCSEACDPSYKAAEEQERFAFETDEEGSGSASSIRAGTKCHDPG